MNKTIITGKIIRETKKDNVTFITLMTRTGKDYEYIPITIFKNDFYNKYFHKEKWISIIGHIHINKHNDSYNTEIICDEMFFVGDANETDIALSEYYRNEENPFDNMQ